MIKKMFHLLINQLRVKNTPQVTGFKNFDVQKYPLPEANKWILSEFVVKRLVPVVGFVPYPLDELMLMSSVVSYFQPDLIVEWGTHYGASARVFYEITQFLELNTEIHSIDLPLGTAHIENLSDRVARGKYVKKLPVQLHTGDGLSVAGTLVAQKQPTSPLFFLDGDHEYETVRNELQTIKQFATRAVILTHDTFYQEHTANYNIGPYKAVTEFAAEYSLSVYSTLLGLPGISLLYW
jgi:cephalosporin hydroxylase